MSTDPAKATSAQAARQRFERAVLRNGLYSNAGNLRYFLETWFRDIDLHGKRVLDVGGGQGLLAFYAASMGANEAVCLEPFSDGSRDTSDAGFRTLQNAPGCPAATLVRESLQTYDPGADRFDVIVMRNSINHLDERACMKLHVSTEARVAYTRILARLACMAAPGAVLVVADCSRHNVFRTLGLRNPFMPTIEWGKHQPPHLWAELLGEVGFEHPRITWSTFNRLRGTGRLVLSNAVAAYLTLSHFQLRMQFQSDQKTA